LDFARCGESGDNRMLRGWLACAVILPGSALSAGGNAVNE